MRFVSTENFSAEIMRVEGYNREHVIRDRRLFAMLQSRVTNRKTMGYRTYIDR